MNLDTSTWDGALKSNDVLMVDFYKNDCFACGKLAPEFTKVAAQAGAVAKHYGKKVALGKIDAGSLICDRYSSMVESYPTVLLFVKGKASVYDGQKVAPELLAALKSAAASA